MIPEPTWLEAAINGPWMVAGLAVDITPLIVPAVNAGGHIRVGLEDAPFQSMRSNREWVEHAVTEITKAGGVLATPDDVRRALNTPPSVDLQTDAG